MNIDDLRG